MPNPSAVLYENETDGRLLIIRDVHGNRISIQLGQLVTVLQTGLNENQLQSFIEELCDA
jgi:hypothetical protein